MSKRFLTPIEFEQGLLKTNLVTVSVNDTDTTIDSFSTSQYSCAEYFIQARQQSVMLSARKIMVLFDGTDVSIHEYAITEGSSGAPNVTFSISSSAGTATLTANSSDAATYPITIKTMIQYIKN